MKHFSLTIAASLALAAVLGAAGCKSASAPPPVAAQSANIPNRPEKLQFPPLQYEPPNPADYRVELKSGPVAYLVPDRELPLINIEVAAKTGDYVEPEGKEGLAGLTGYLLARGGIKSRSADDLEERLAFLAADLSSSISDSSGNVSLNLLSKDIDEGLSILREVLSEPRFEQEKLDLARQQELQGLRRRNDESSSIEGRERRFLAFGEAFWANRYSTEDSLKSISREDLAAFHRKWFCPSNFVVSVSGDFDRADMIQKLEKLFSQWPYTGQTPPTIPTNTQFAKPGVFIVNKDVNQGRVAMMLPGILRDDPDYFAGVLMNNILGGGGFNSRIMERVRSDEGLAYDARSSFNGGIYYPLTFSAAFQSKSRTVSYAMSIISEEMTKMTQKPPTEKELESAKRSYIDTLPHAFATKAMVASRFADDEFTGRYAKNPGYWKNYCAAIEKVSTEDVLRVARRFLHPDQMTVLIVGQKDEILKGHPEHPGAKLDAFAPGGVVDVPLRDPLTMKPMKPAN